MMFSRQRFVVGISALGLAACAHSETTPPVARLGNHLLSAVNPGEETADFGALLDAQSPQDALEMLSPQALANLPPIATPARVVLTHVPPVVAQGGELHDLGSPGTCEAQSFAYGLGSSIASLTSSGTALRNVTLAENQVSRAWMYAKQTHEIDDGRCGGTRAYWYLNELVLNGSASEAQIPYEPNCSYLEAVDTHVEPIGAQRFTIAGFSARKINSDLLNEVLPIMKAILAAGFPIAFSGTVPSGYIRGLSLKDGVYYPVSWQLNSGHGQFIIGYDDTIGDANLGRGAFLVQNSFGPFWPFVKTPNPAGGGRIWYAYKNFFEGQTLVATGYPLRDRTSGIPLRTADSTAPSVTVTRAYQWSPIPSRVYLIVQLACAAPMRLKRIALTEHPPTSVTATGYYADNFLSQNYALLQRNDGHAFLHGRYTIAIQTERTGSQTTPGTTYSYEGEIEVKAPRYSSQPPASMKGVTVLDSTLNVAQLS
jgi:hypothetical protein